MHENYTYEVETNMWYDNPLIASYDERGKRDETAHLNVYPVRINIYMVN